MNKLIRKNLSLKPAMLLVSLLVGGIFLSGCASTPENPEDVLVKRAEKRWAAVLAADYETAYSYYSPGYRSGTSVVDFAIGLKSRKVKWTSAQYKEHSCLENTCTVAFDVGYRVNKPVPGLDKWDGSSVIKETWIKTGGEWWYMDKRK